MRRLYRALVRAVVTAANVLAPAAPPVPSVVKFNEHPWARRRYGKAVEGGASVLNAAIGRVVRVALELVTPARLALGALAIAALLAMPDLGPEALLAEVVPVIDTKRDDHTKLLNELEVIQSTYEGKEMPHEVGERFDTLAKEAEELQAEIDRLMEREGKLKELQKWRGEVQERTLPGDLPGETKLKPAESDVGRVAGYVTLGDYVLASKAVQAYVDAGAPQGGAPVVNLGVGLLKTVTLPDGTVVIPVDSDERKLVTELYETKAVPTIGTGVIEPSRLPGITQVQKDIALRLRDVLSISQTGTDSVSYVRRDGTTRAAAETAAGTAKPEAAFTFDLVTEAISTVAVHMPVQVQQLQDWAMLRSEIDNFLLYDLGKREEEQIMYGDGVGVNLEGILVNGSVGDIATNGRYDGSIHTFIDVVRMGITDTRVNGYQPNAVVIHPFDWETILLEKGTDNRYVWVVVQDDNGSRIWGLPVVETNSAEANRGSTTEERNILVGDFRVGATLVDRMRAQIMVGLINAQFTQNLRTILAEERIALALRAPAAFAKFETQADVP